MSDAVNTSDLDMSDADAAPKPLTEKQLAARKQRRTILVACLAAVVVLCAVALQWDRLMDNVTSGWVGGGSTPTRSSAPVQQYSRAQGAQDAPRAETTENRRADREKCMETLRLRRVVAEVARDSCNKMVNGIYH